MRRDVRNEPLVPGGPTYEEVVRGFFEVYVFPPGLNYNGQGVSRDNCIVEKVERDGNSFWIKCRARYSGSILGVGVAERARVHYDDGHIRVDIGGLKGIINTEGIANALIPQLSQRRPTPQPTPGPFPRPSGGTGKMILALEDGKVWSVNPEGYQRQVDDLVSRGHRVTCVSGYSMGAGNGLATVWSRERGPAWVYHSRMSVDRYQSRFSELVGQGYRLTHLSGYSVGNQDRYAAIWVKQGGPAWVTHHGMSSDRYQNRTSELVKQGYRLTHVSGYSVGNQDRYAAIWVKQGGPAWLARHRMNSDGYQRNHERFVGQGYRLEQVSGYSMGNQDGYAALWVKNG